MRSSVGIRHIRQGDFVTLCGSQILTHSLTHHTCFATLQPCVILVGEGGVYVCVDLLWGQVGTQDEEVDEEEKESLG